ncbi:MAG: methyltransferase [Vicingaceae bacterium]|nr:methyltransferase [Vicingaceae bacterium]
MSAPFQFKEFSVEQEHCAMKVGTDGVLLGAWTTIKSGSALDIGTGTGLIALMLAQRSQNLIIDAIDIEKSAYFQAEININKSKWNSRIAVHHSSLQSFYPNKIFDTIISNPPFFVKSYQPPQNERAIARHNEQLSFEDLIIHVVRLLKPDGIFSLILPMNEAVDFICNAFSQGLFLNRKCEVKPNLTKATKRILLEFSKTKPNTVIEESLTIETEKRHYYTEDYKKLTGNFYLKL